MFDDLLNKLLTARGITTSVAREKFLKPNYTRDIYDPFLLSGMKRAVERILRAIEHDEKIIVFADYDADGVPGAVILTEFFRKIKFNNFEIYIPDRQTENYGLMSESVREFAKNGTKLIITVDCGISNVREIALAARLGLDTVVTDHHLPPPDLPLAYAIINPKLPGDRYPDKMLCGAAVAFKLVQGLIRRDRSQRENLASSIQWEKTLLDLVAIATVSDRVPLMDENRALTAFGLMILQRTPRVGLNALFTVTRLKRQALNEDDIGFTLGPRINSAGRMSHASEAYFLLTTKSPVEAQAMAERLEKQNSERKKSVEKILQACDARFDPNGALWPAIIVTGDPDWPAGVLGLSASRLAEQKFSRPVFLWGGAGAEVKGSCRSDGSVNLVELMRTAGGDKFFTHFGGHAAAGGFSLPLEKVEELEKRLIEARKQIPKLEPAGAIKPDTTVSIDEINDRTWRLIEQLAPFGVGNPKPIFHIPNLEIYRAKSFGNGGVHLELSFAKTNGEIVAAIGFFTALDKFTGVKLESGARINLLATLEKSYFKREPELRLRIVDINSGLDRHSA